jgi:hypothetical protein
MTSYRLLIRRLLREVRHARQFRSHVEVQETELKLRFAMMMYEMMGRS